MMCLLILRRCWVGVLVAAVLASVANTSSAQLPSFRELGQRLRLSPLAQTEEAAATAAAPMDAAADEDAAAPEVVDTRNAKKTNTIGPREIRLHLQDGAIIAGDLSIDVLTVETDFGTLKVPIDKIRSFRPGLNSFPQLSERLTRLVADLGNDDYATREEAHKQLVHWGLPIHKLMIEASDGDNTERKRHLTEIRVELEELAADADEFEDHEAEPAIVRPDTVETTEFTIAGRIVEQEFKIASKYGGLVIKLADINNGQRESAAAEPILKRLSVDGSFIAQQRFKSSGIRVKAGDKVTIRAEGKIVMTPWGGESFSTPDGGANYGWYLPSQIPGGALVAKIGASGDVFKAGAKHSFVARTSGVLQFAIGIDHDYASDGYSYPGQYDVRVKVEPK